MKTMRTGRWDIFQEFPILNDGLTLLEYKQWIQRRRKELCPFCHQNLEHLLIHTSAPNNNSSNLLEGVASKRLTLKNIESVTVLSFVISLIPVLHRQVWCCQKELFSYPTEKPNIFLPPNLQGEPQAGQRQKGGIQSLCVQMWPHLRF